MYLKQGVFYSQIIHYVPGRTQKILDKVNIPESVDVLYANAGLVATGGHAYSLYQKLFEYQMLKEFSSPEEMDTKAYFIVDSEKELEEKWDKILAQKPGIIKTYLEISEEYTLRKNDLNYGDERGIEPELLKKIVTKSHKSGLRVAVHIESVKDFRNALKDRMDIIAHLPGFRTSKYKTTDDYKLTETDTQRAAKHNVTGITTTALSKCFCEMDPATLSLIRSNQIANLSLLKAKGVSLVFGSDDINSTSVAEAIYVSSFGTFSNTESLRILCESTPESIFSKRRIGKLTKGLNQVI